jgi:hypothetical protein
LIAELVYRKKGLDLKNFDCCRKKKEQKINILEFGRELGKDNLEVVLPAP